MKRINLKTIFFFSLFFQCITSFGQFIPPTPEPSIIRPEIILPESQLSNYAKSYNKKLKKVIIDKTTIEYDKNGNIIKETTVGSPSTETTLYTYKDNVLVEKIQSTVTDSKEVKRLNADNIREAERGNEESYAVVQFEDNIPTYIYKAVLDKNDRVISYTFEQKKSGGDERYNFVRQTNIVYDKDKVLDIITNDTEKEHYFYSKNLLVKKEKIMASGKRNELESTEYSYDGNKNLIRIKYNAEKSYDGKVQYHDNRVKDSAVYNNKNKLIWAGQKTRFVTYKYDDNNNITEYCQFDNGRMYRKEEYFYENNLITKIIKTTNTNPNEENFVVTTNYNYKDGKLIGYQKDNKECSYEYADDKQLKRITKTNKYINKKTGEVGHQDISVTNFIYNKNILIIQSKYGGTNTYEFYE